MNTVEFIAVILFRLARSNPSGNIACKGKVVPVLN
jgi:hypothetical protein